MIVSCICKLSLTSKYAFPKHSVNKVHYLFTSNSYDYPILAPTVIVTRYKNSSLGHTYAHSLLLIIDNTISTPPSFFLASLTNTVPQAEREIPSPASKAPPSQISHSPETPPTHKISQPRKWAPPSPALSRPRKKTSAP